MLATVEVLKGILKRAPVVFGGRVGGIRYVLGDRVEDFSHTLCL